MKNILYFIALTYVTFASSNLLLAIEESTFSVSGNDTTEVMLEKLGAPKSSKLPIKFTKNNTEISVEQSTNKMITIEFNPAHAFTPGEKDLFEKIEVNDGSDRKNHNLILADSKSGRIFHINYELKITKLELLPPWKSSAKLMNLKNIMENISSPKIGKKK